MKLRSDTKTAIFNRSEYLIKVRNQPSSRFSIQSVHRFTAHERHRKILALEQIICYLFSDYSKSKIRLNITLRSQFSSNFRPKISQNQSFREWKGWARWLFSEIVHSVCSAGLFLWKVVSFLSDSTLNIFWQSLNIF